MSDRYKKPDSHYRREREGLPPESPTRWMRGETDAIAHLIHNEQTAPREIDVRLKLLPPGDRGFLNPDDEYQDGLGETIDLHWFADEGPQPGKIVGERKQINDRFYRYADIKRSDITTTIELKPRWAHIYAIAGIQSRHKDDAARALDLDLTWKATDSVGLKYDDLKEMVEDLRDYVLRHGA